MAANGPRRPPGRKEVLILDPARSIIQRCGGATAVAHMTGRDVSRVRRWTFPRERGGSDGIIPMKAAREIAQKAGIPIAAIITGPDTQLTRNDLHALSLMVDGAQPREIAKAMRLSIAKAKTIEAELRRNAAVNPDAWSIVERRRQCAAQIGGVA